MSESVRTQTDNRIDQQLASSRLLAWLTLTGLLLGIVGGEILFQLPDKAAQETWISNLSFVGQTIFLGPLRVVLIPLVFCSVLNGIASLGQSARLKRVAWMTIGTFWALMLVSAALAALLMAIFNPGHGAHLVAEAATIGKDPASDRILAASGMGFWGAIRQLFTEILTTNPVAAAAEGRLLPIVAFSIALGLALSAAGPAGKPALDLARSLFAGMMQLVRWILWTAPIGAAALLAATVGKTGAFSLTGSLGLYLISIIAVLLVLSLIVLPLILWTLTRENPYRLFQAVRPALVTAFSTTSSSATVPVTLSCLATTNVSTPVADFVIPIGTAGNLLGTAAFQAAAVVFLYQAYDIPLHATGLAVLVITTWFAAIGCAGIPSAAVVAMVLIIESVNGVIGGSPLPIAAITILLAVDRLIDMFRTATNVWGHIIVAAVISKWVGVDSRDDLAAR